eukprot:Platyproteum_vivax@DN16011_c0_g1_i1.p1
MNGKFARKKKRDLDVVEIRKHLAAEGRSRVSHDELFGKHKKVDRGWGGYDAVGWGVLGHFGSEKKDDRAQQARRAVTPIDGSGRIRYKMVKNEKGLWVKEKVESDNEDGDSPDSPTTRYPTSGGIQGSQRGSRASHSPIPQRAKDYPNSDDNSSSGGRNCSRSSSSGCSSSKTGSHSDNSRRRGRSRDRSKDRIRGRIRARSRRRRSGSSSDSSSDSDRRRTPRHRTRSPRSGSSSGSTSGSGSGSISSSGNSGS